MSGPPQLPQCYYTVATPRAAAAFLQRAPTTLLLLFTIVSVIGQIDVIREPGMLILAGLTKKGKAKLFGEGQQGEDLLHTYSKVYDVARVPSDSMGHTVRTVAKLQPLIAQTGLFCSHSVVTVGLSACLHECLYDVLPVRACRSGLRWRRKSPPLRSASAVRLTQQEWETPWIWRPRWRCWMTSWTQYLLC